MKVQLLLCGSNLGNTIFYGSALRALPYFAERGLTCPNFINPADFMLDLMDPEEETDPTGTKEFL